MPEPSFDRIKLDIENRIAIIRLSDPARRNAMSLAMREQCIAALRGLEQAGEADAIVITGDGDKAFSAGADIDEVAKRTTSGEFSTPAQLRRELPRLLESLRLPTIAAINGYCLGAGLEVALACTLRIAADNAKLGLPEINLGVIPGAGGTQRLPRFVGKSKAMEMVLLGQARMMDAAEAERVGLVSRVVPLANLMAEALKAAERICELSLPVVMMAKESVNRAFETTLEEGVRFERRLFHSTFAIEDQKEGMTAFVEKRKPVFQNR